MGGHGGLNILPQKRWNVYNYDNREKVRQDEEAASKEEQLKREQSRKRDSELRLQQLRKSRILATPHLSTSPPPLESESKKPDSNHINLFEGIRIFDPIDDENKGSNKKMKREKEAETKAKAVNLEEEKYRLGYGVAGKGVKLPWYMAKPSDDKEDVKSSGGDGRYECGGGGSKFGVGKSGGGKKSLEELREERLKRERREKERERVLMHEKLRWDDSAFSSMRRR